MATIFVNDGNDIIKKIASGQLLQKKSSGLNSSSDQVVHIDFQTNETSLGRHGESCPVSNSDLPCMFEMRTRQGKIQQIVPAPIERLRLN